jgi:hypothetical protein
MTRERVKVGGREGEERGFNERQRGRRNPWKRAVENLQFYDCHRAPLHYNWMRGRKPGNWRGRRGEIRCGDGLGLEGYHTEIQEKTTFFHDQSPVVHTPIQPASQPAKKEESERTKS